MKNSAMSPKSYRRSILIIDDDRIMTEVLCNIARDSSFDVESVCDASELSATMVKRADLIMLDLMMPNIDGVDVVSVLAKWKYTGGLILMSGLGEECLESVASMAHAFKLNFLGSLHKPINRSALKAMLARFSFEHFRENWQGQKKVNVSSRDLIHALTNQHVKAKEIVTVTAKESEPIGREIVAFLEKEGLELDHNEILNAAAKDSDANQFVTLFLLRKACNACLENAKNDEEVSIRLSAGGLAYALADEAGMGILSFASRKSGQLIISFDYRDICKNDDILRPHYAEIEEMGIRLAVDFVSLLRADQIKHIVKPFARCVLYGGAVLHKEYSHILREYFEHANKLGIETVLSGVCSLSELEEARKAGFNFLRATGW